jgi:hypothetical protein
MTPRQLIIAELKTMSDRLGSLMVQDCVTIGESMNFLIQKTNLNMLANDMVQQDCLDDEASQPDQDILERPHQHVNESEGNVL